MSGLLGALHSPAGLVVWFLLSLFSGGATAWWLRRRGGASAAPWIALGLVGAALAGDLVATSPGAGLGFWIGALPLAALLSTSDAAVFSGLAAGPLLWVATMFAPASAPSATGTALEPAGRPAQGFSAAAAFAALVVCVLAWPALGQRGVLAPWAGVIGVLPAALVWLAVAGPRAASVRKPLDADAAPHEALHPPEARAAARAAWSQLQAAPADAAPWYAVPALRSPAAADPLWAAAGGHGPRPAQLDGVLGAGGGEVSLLVDLPAASIAVVQRALILDAVLARGERVLVVPGTPSSPSMTELERGSPEGLDVVTLTRGLDALRRAVAAHTPPAIAILSPEELGDGGIALLSGTADEARAVWAASVGLVLLPELDAAEALPIMHRIGVLRRLHLATAQPPLRVRYVATGASGGASLRLLQHALPGHPIRPVTLDPAARPEIGIWLADWRFIAEPGEPWISRVLRVTGPLHVSDPLHLVPVGAVPAGLGQIDASVSFSGAASLAWLGAAGVVAHVRAAPQRVHTGEASHDALWALCDDPVTRMLAAEGHLAALLSRGRLDPPQAVVGAHNRSVAREHTRRALSDGPQVIELLRDAFGPSLVDEVSAGHPIVGFRAWREPNGSIRRSAVLQVAAAPDTPLPHAAITDRRVDVVEATSGRVLAVVDEIHAISRYHPRRVFRIGAEAWEVPMHAHDARRGRVEVTPVDRATQPTLPVRATVVTAREALAAPEAIRRGPVTFRLGTFDAFVDESVRGVRRSRSAEVAYPEVRAPRFRTRVRLIAFDRAASPAAMVHLGASLRAVMAAQLRIDAEEVITHPVPAGWWPQWPSGVVFADRYVQGAGLAEALDEHRVSSLLDWTYAILHRCPCERGCARCTPTDALESGEIDKAGVLALLGG